MDSPIDVIAAQIELGRSDLLRATAEIAEIEGRLGSLTAHRDELAAGLDEWAAALTYLTQHPGWHVPPVV